MRVKVKAGYIDTRHAAIAPSATQHDNAPRYIISLYIRCGPVFGGFTSMLPLVCTTMGLGCRYSLQRSWQIACSGSDDAYLPGTYGAWSRTGRLRSPHFFMQDPIDWRRTNRADLARAGA